MAMSEQDKYFARLNRQAERAEKERARREKAERKDNARRAKEQEWREADPWKGIKFDDV